MIRFVDIRGQGTGSRFAYFDTRTDKFRTVGNNGNNAWSIFSDFEMDAGRNVEVIERCRNVTPEWAFREDPNETLWSDQFDPEAAKLERDDMLHRSTL